MSTLATPEQRLLRHALQHQKVELLATLETVEEICDEMVRSAPAGGQIHGDLGIMLGAARELKLQFERLAPSVSNQPADEASLSGHSLRNNLHVLIDYAEWLLKTSDEGWDRRGDLQFIIDAGWNSLHPIIHHLADPAVLLAPTIDAVALRLAAEVVPLHVDPASILIVDDNVDICKNLTRRIARFGHRAESVNDGATALDAIRRRAGSPDEFELVLLDVLMLPLNGPEVLKAMKEDPRTRETPVIVISSFEHEETVRACIALGAEDYLPKLGRPAQLEVRINACLQRHRLHRKYLGLLGDVLPAPIVEEYVRDGKVEPKGRDQVAVLFADIEGFTKFSQGHSPNEVVDFLGKLFSRWDGITQSPQAPIQKIKTIGDGFMAAAGLLEEVANPVGNCVACGLKMIDALAEIRPDLRTRIGIHVGPVVAGLLGTRQFLYDLWGDAVNKASRIESYGKPGYVNLSEEAWNDTKDLYEGWEGPETEDVKSLGLTKIHRICPAKARRKSGAAAG